MKHSYFLRTIFTIFFISIFSLAFAQPGVTVISIDASCNGGNDGAASATATGGTTPYTYAWSNTATTPLINSLTAGTYTVTVTDNNGLSVVDSAIVGEPTMIVGTTTLDSNSTCFNSADGGATVNASGGTGPYTYNWSNSASSASVTGLMVGVYTVTITDANGCTSSTIAIINSNDNVRPTAQAGDTTLYLDFNGQLTVTGADLDSGSTDNCSISSFQILNGNLDCSDIGANTVRLIAVDSDGNRDTASAIVTVIDTIAPNVLTMNSSIFLDSNRVASLMVSDIDSATSDACGIDSLWVNASFDCSDAGMNSVWLYAVDLNGNIDSASAMVTVIDTTTIDTVEQAQDACINYTWSVNGQTYTASGIYTFTDTNSLGCDDTFYRLILSVDTAMNMIDTVVACDSYTWRDGNEYTANNNSATFIIKNSNNCDSIVYTLNLTVNSSDSVTVDQASACNSYTWPQNNQTYSSTGTYTHTVTNASGCDSILTLELEIRPLYLQVINMSDSLFAFENHPNATYQWIDCSDNSAISGATNRGYKPDTTGFFKVVVSNGLCSDTSACSEVIAIGIDEHTDLNPNLNIYPNPTKDNFTFEVEQFGENDQLFINDMKGELILQKQVNSNRTQIETSTWNQGVYFLYYNGMVKKLVVTR